PADEGNICTEGQGWSPGQFNANPLKLCIGHGTCGRATSGAAYSCVSCDAGYFGSFCEHQICNFPTGCQPHSECDTSLNACICFKHWGPPGVNGCTTNDCGA